MIVHTTPAAKRVQPLTPKRGFVVSRSRRKLSPHHDHFERHAEEAAELISRGEVSVARMLTRRSAAAYPLPNSQGDPLPIDLRTRFEDAFGADLSAVRVHHDPAAASAARSERAIAFTAGRDIFFASGEYRPDSADGRRVIAHELAHVLQQTGQPGPGGSLHATATTGSGPIQRVDQEHPFAESDVSPHLAEIVATHQGAATDTVAQIEIAALAAASLPNPDPLGFFEARQKLILSGDKDPVWNKTHGDLHPSTLSCLYDCLKWAGHWEGAASLLMVHSTKLKTLFLSNKAYAAFIAKFTMAGAVDMLYSIWNRDDFFSGARPRDVIDRMTIYLLGPTRAPSKQTLAKDRDFVEAATEELKKAEKPGQPIQNELFFATVGAVIEFERLRFSIVEDEERKVGTLPRLAERKWHLSHRFKARAEKELEEAKKKVGQTRADRGYSLEAFFFWARDFLPALYTIADVGRTLWSGVAELQDPHKLAPNFGTTSAAVIQTMAEDSFFDTFKPAIDKLAETIFFRHPDGTLPTAEEYNSRKERSEKDLKRLSYDSFERPLANLLKQPSPDKGGPETMLFPPSATAALDKKRWLRLAWVFKSISDLLATLDLYKFREDVLFVQQAAAINPKYAATDHRDAHRIRMARALGWIAQVSLWTDLDQTTGRVRNATETIGTWVQVGPVVAFVGDWQEDKDRAIPYLMTEMEHPSSTVVERWAPFTIEEIVLFYQGLDYREFTSQISTLLQAEKGQYNPKQKPLMERARDQARLTRPIRYRIPADQWVYAIPPPTAAQSPAQSPTLSPPKTIVELVREHPKTAALAKRHQAKFNYEPIGIVPEKQAPDAVVWLMPRPIDLLKKLQANDAINLAIEAALKTTKTIELTLPTGAKVTETLDPLTVAQLKALAWDRWWFLFENLVKFDAARQLVTDMQLANTLETEKGTAWDALLDAQREAFNHERRRLVEHYWKPILKGYNRTAKAYDKAKVGTETVTVRSLPMEMMRFINRFLLQILEREDITKPKTPGDETPERDAHLAMAFIEMSALVEEKLGAPSGSFGIDIKGDIVFDFVPVLYVVLDRIDKGGLEPFLVLEERDKADIITTGKARLEKVLEYMEELATRNQKDYGIVGVAGDGTIEDSGHIHPVDWDLQLDRSTPFTIDGRTWHIVEVRKSFTYHPGAWLRRGEKSPRRNVGSLLKLEGDKDYRSEKQRGSEVLMLISQEEGGQTVEVKEGGENDTQSEEFLTRLTWDATMHARYEHMKALAEAIETLASYALDLAELFPGVGPAVAATRLLTAALSFISGEGEELISGLVKDPEALLDTIKQKMTDALEPGKILEFLLFDFRGFDTALKKPDKKVGAKIAGSTSGLLRKILRRVRTMGLGLLNALGRLGLSVRGKREMAQMAVIQRPLVVRILSTVADYYYVFRQLLSEAPELLDELAEFKNQAGEFTEKLNATLTGMSEIELPSALITVEDLVNVAVDVIGHRLGGKYKFGVKILFKILEVIGAKQKVVSAIAGIIKDVTGIEDGDVFPLWRTTFLPWIQKQFTQAQKWLHGTMAPVLKEVGLDLPTPKSEPKIIGEEFPEEVPEVQPYGDVYADALATPPDLSGGRPLAPRLRAQAETRFGHDFGHVRLHTGEAAEKVNTPIGARALTSGSHILLNGPQPQSLDHSHVLRHELAHVVQQTGPRPLGTPSDPSPRTGSPGGGVRVDSSAESSANRVANQTAHRGMASGPIAAGRGSGGGFQPSFVDEIGRRFLKYLVNYDEIEEDVTKVEAKAKGRGLIARAVRDQIAELPDKLTQAFSINSLHVHPSVKGTFESKKKEISDHLSNQQKDIRNVVRVLAIESSDPMPLPKGGTAEKPKMHLNARKLEAKLSRYIFGKTGILLEIDLRQKSTGRKGPHDKLVVDNPIEKLTVRFVHLPPISGNAALWKQVLLSRPADPLHPTIPTTITEAERNELRPRIRQVLHFMGPASTVWNRSAYQLDVAVFRKIEELKALEAQVGTKGLLPAIALKPATDYVKDTGTSDPTFGQIGLRLSTYDDRKKGGSQWGKERESHHITQYLLGAYFRGGKGAKLETEPQRRAFKLKFKKNPNIYTSAVSAKDEFVNKVVSKKTVEIEAIEKGRGGIMPAILLARPVHRLGGLHITPGADDFLLDPEETTQAGALNSVFQDALPLEYRKAEAEALRDKDDKPDYPSFLAYKQTVGDTKVGEQIYDAIQDTYKMLRGYMQPRLKTALATRERDYFNEIAKDTPKSSSLGEVTGRQMEVVYQAAVQRNDSVLAAKGWIGQ